MAPVEWRESEGEKWFKFNSKFDNFKYFYGHWLSIILFILVILGCIFAGSYIYKNKVAFFENPLVYGAKQIGEKNDGLVYCDCYIEIENHNFLKFKINDSGYFPVPSQGFG